MNRQRVTLMNRAVVIGIAAALGIVEIVSSAENGLVGYWSLNDTPKTVLASDSSGYKRHAIVSGTAAGTNGIVGGAVRWAPGAAVWLSDAISVFEECGWDWAYHSYSGWNGWNPTFEADDAQNSEADGGKRTDRLEVLLKAWGKNKQAP